MVDARWATLNAIANWLSLYHDWTPREARLTGLAHGIPYTAKSWFPPEWLSDAFRKAVSRELRALEAEGVIVRITGGSGRVTHVIPTTLLVDVILEEADCDNDRAKIRKTLGLTNWGRRILAELEGGDR